MHPAHAHQYGVTVPDEAERQLQHRSGIQMLTKIGSLDRSPLPVPRTIFSYRPRPGPVEIGDLAGG